jgi:hypothetical protein
MTLHHQGGYTMLGYGDIILPGLLVSYLRRADLDLGLTIVKVRPAGIYLSKDLQQSPGGIVHP